jgi:inositol 1,4,5-triphosphate receptor type 1
MLIANLLAGIIIDKFGQLRDQQEEIKKDMLGYCFICGRDRETIEKKIGT